MDFAGANRFASGLIDISPRSAPFGAMHPARELLVVLPVFNEQASIRKVVVEWMLELENWTDDFLFLAINDGSKDGTAAALARLKMQFGERLEVHERENRGHGQTCLEGYRLACERGFKYVLQIDSDGQCDPQYFFRFWRDRDRYDVIYGRRARRDDGLRRKVASLVLKLALLIRCGVHCEDANVPYRLMRTDKLLRFLHVSLARLLPWRTCGVGSSPEARAFGPGTARSRSDFESMLRRRSRVCVSGSFSRRPANCFGNWRRCGSDRFSSFHLRSRFPPCPGGSCE